MLYFPGVSVMTTDLHVKKLHHDQGVLHGVKQSFYEHQRTLNMPFYCVWNSNVLGWFELCGEPWWRLREMLKGMCSRVNSKLILSGQDQEHKRSGRNILTPSRALQSPSHHHNEKSLCLFTLLTFLCAFPFEMVNGENWSKNNLQAYF